MRAMNELANDVGEVVTRWWQSNVFVHATFNDISDPKNEVYEDYQVVREFEFFSAVPNSLSVSLTVYDDSFGLCLRWQSRVTCAAGFEMGSVSVTDLALLLGLVCTGRFLIEERPPLLRWAGSYAKAVLKAKDADLLKLFEPKSWIRTTDEVLPWRRATLIQTASWR